MRTAEGLRAAMRERGLTPAEDSSWPQLVDKLIGDLVEPRLIQPTFLLDYPIEMTPLAKTTERDPRLVERFEGFIGGMEVANSFTELNDPIEQAARLRAQEENREQFSDEDFDRLDEDFITAVEHGMPPAGGLGLGIDRMVMILTGPDDNPRGGAVSAVAYVGVSAHGPGAVPRRLGLFVLLTAVMVMAAACGAGEADTPTPSSGSEASAIPGTETPKRGGVLTLANRGDPPAAFDTMRTSSIALHHVGGAIFGPGNLVRRCRENMYLVCPDLASNWVANPGFTEWEFTIRPNVTWHDGEPFTAEDVQFWYGLAADGWVSDGAFVRAPAYFRGDLGDIESVEVLEFNRVRVTLAEPNPHYLTVLANPRLRIAHPKHLMAPLLEDGEYSVAPLDVGAVGTGPFKLDRYEAGSLVRVVRNDDYWERGAGGNLPYLDGIDYVVMPNPTAMDAAFRTGRIDGGARGEGHYLTQERKAAIDSQLGPDEVFYGEMQGGMFRLGFNVLREGPWQDPDVRQAISLWIDRETAIPTVLGGFGYISPTFSPANPFTSADFTTWQRFNRGALEERRAEAVALMAEAGQSDGFRDGLSVPRAADGPLRVPAQPACRAGHRHAY